MGLHEMYGGVFFGGAFEKWRVESIDVHIAVFLQFGVGKNSIGKVVVVLWVRVRRAERRSRRGLTSKMKNSEIHMP